MSAQKPEQESYEDYVKNHWLWKATEWFAISIIVFLVVGVGGVLLYRLCRGY